MNYWLILTPAVSALIGWFFARFLTWLLFHPRNPRYWVGFKIQGWIPKRHKQFSVNIGQVISHEFDLISMVEQQMLDPAVLEKITPEIERHIDHFLRVKLKDAMPMVAMFVGDKTITQMKEVFMVEMKTLFPEIMRNYVNEMQKNQFISEKIRLKLAAIPSSKIELFMLETFSKELRYVQLAGALLGFLIGAFQVIGFLLIFF